MELDELRRQWQQPEAAPEPLDAEQLNLLLKQQSGGLVEKMRFNVRMETALTAVVAVSAPFLLGLASNFLQYAQVVSMFLLALVMLVYYYRKLVMLGEMTRPEGNVLANLQRLSGGLRRMLRFYYRLTIAVGPASLLLVLEYAVGKELTRPDGVRLKLLLGVGAGLLVFALLMHWVVSRLTRWYLQRLYGQHLDRLDSMLQELQEPAD